MKNRFFARLFHVAAAAAVAAAACVAAACAAETVEPVFDLDPYSFAAGPGAGEFRAFGRATCHAPGFASPELVVTATATPESCDDPSWAALGIGAWSSPEDYWRLAFVKAPDTAGSAHRFELTAMARSVWGGHKEFATSLGRTVHKKWEWGRRYELRLSCAPGRVAGEIRDAETGEPVFEEAFAVPESESRAWRPALCVDGNLRGTLAGVHADAPRNLAGTAAARISLPPFVPSGRETGVRGAATDFYHVETIDGVDWAVDPVGRATFLAATQHIKPEGLYSDALGYSPYGRFVATNFPTLAEWADDALLRLDDWGFNMIGNACALGLLARRAFPHARNVQLGQRVCRGDPDWFICEWKYSPCTALPNVFHPRFREACEWRAREQCAPFRDDPWLVGWFIDNELAWWAHRWSRPATGLFDAVAALPPTHSARKELERWLHERRETKEATFEDKRDFLAHYAETYYEIAASAIRKADPNHMVMGSRYAGIAGAHPVVWEAAGRHCDVVTFNCYPWADLGEGVVYDEKGGTTVAERLREYHGYAKKPFFVTEWSFMALDAGHPSLCGAGQRFRTQSERSAGIDLFARTMLASPHVVGYDFYKWFDDPPEAGTRWTREDCNYGLVDGDGRPYAEVVETFRALHENVAQLRSAPSPDGRVGGGGDSSAAAKRPSERDRYFADAAARRKTADGAGGDGTDPASAVAAVATVEADGAWVLSNAFVRLSGKVGSAELADEIAFGGKTVGSWGAVACFFHDGLDVWLAADRLDSAVASLDPETGIASVTLRGVASGAAAPGANGGFRPRFAVTHRLSLAPGAKEALAEIVAFENLGGEPLALRSLLMRPAPDPSLGTPPVPAPETPKLWGEPARARWTVPVGADGGADGFASWGVESRDRATVEFRFWVHGRDRSVHADASFAPGGKVAAREDVAPGATWLPAEPMSALVRAFP